jgi:hypothetical protein
MKKWIFSVLFIGAIATAAYAQDSRAQTKKNTKKNYNSSNAARVNHPVAADSAGIYPSGHTAGTDTVPGRRNASDSGRAMADTGRVVLDSTGHNNVMGTTGRTDSAESSRVGADTSRFGATAPVGRTGDSTSLSLPASGQNDRNIKQKSKIKTADGKEIKIKTKDGKTKVKD